MCVCVCVCPSHSCLLCSPVFSCVASEERHSEGSGRILCLAKTGSSIYTGPLQRTLQFFIILQELMHDCVGLPSCINVCLCVCVCVSCTNVWDCLLLTHGPVSLYECVCVCLCLCTPVTAYVRLCVDLSLNHARLCIERIKYVFIHTSFPPNSSF